MPSVGQFSFTVVFFCVRFGRGLRKLATNHHALEAGGENLSPPTVVPQLSMGKEKKEENIIIHIHCHLRRGDKAQESNRLGHEKSSLVPARTVVVIGPFF